MQQSLNGEGRTRFSEKWIWIDDGKSVFVLAPKTVGLVLQRQVCERSGRGSNEDG